MSKFHSVLSRRDFMKALGLAGAGLGAAAATTPVFHDLDELASAPTNTRQRAWWIKEIDHPTQDVDWSIVHRHHGFHSAQSSVMVSRYLPGGPDEYRALKAAAGDGQIDGIKASTPGQTLRDYALKNAAGGVRAFGREDSTGGTMSRLNRAKTPEELGVPKWQGTPEENTKMMRAAMVFFGASDIGASEMDEHHKELIGIYGDNISYSYWPFGSSSKWPPPDSVTQPMVMRDVPKFSYDPATSTTTIPSNIPLYSLSYTIPQANEAERTAPASALFGAANTSRYRLRENVRGCTQAFIKGLGYQSLNDTPYRGIPSGFGCALSGLIEGTRHTMMFVSPEHGSTVGIFDLLTDLPVEPTKPIDAGIWNFCHSCGVCADYCPSGSIEPKGGREPTYEPWPSNITPYYPVLPGMGWSPQASGTSEYYKLGRKTYWSDMPGCRIYRDSLPHGCNLCMGACVFNRGQGAMIHDVVRATMATTGVFNSFFASMHGTFGYGLKEGEEKEEWWNMSLPSYGYSTTVGAKHGGY
jgi:reductive dehalogenase